MNHKMAFVFIAVLVLVAGLLPASSVPTAKASPGQVPEAAPGSAIQVLQELQPDARRTQILVLATFHLKQIEKAFKPAMLERLLAKLAEFRPDAVCIESLSGSRAREIELRKEAGSLYGELLDSFASRHLRLAKAALPLVKASPEAAALKVAELLSSLARMKPEERIPEVHAVLALWMAAAYEPVSAALQWSFLTDADKRNQKMVPVDLAAGFDAECAEVNEDFALGLPLARRLGLPTLEPVDDFEDLDAYARIDPQLEKDFQKNPLLAAVSKAPIYAESEALRGQCLEKGDLWPQYVLLNSPRFARADVDAQWGVFLRTRFPSGSDRSRLGLWENRNLKIAARIRAVAALHPGGRVLVIYGAAHKPFLEAYLSQMSDVKIVQLVSIGVGPSNLAAIQ